MSEAPAPPTIGVPKESFPREHRVALVPSSVNALAKLGIKVRIEANAGLAAGFPDARYVQAGAEIVADRATVFGQSDIVVQVRAGGANRVNGLDDLPLMRSGQVLIAQCDPLSEPAASREIAERGVTLFALELVPRITRAQSMDVLSSMATIAGYKAVLLAAEKLPRMFPMLMTAAGTIKPAKVFVIGAGVAGLQAIATAKRLGAIVSAYDVRPAVKDQVQSVGAKFIELAVDAAASEQKGGYAREMGEDFYRRQRELMSQVVADNDVVITTAAVPGKKSPVLVTTSMVEGMSPGSVIVDLAAERGGNCELTKADETVVHDEVHIFGPTNLPSTVPYHASEMYSRNVLSFIKNLVPKGQLQINLEDEIIRDSMVSRDGQVTNPRIKELLGEPQPAA